MAGSFPLDVILRRPCVPEAAGLVGRAAAVDADSGREAPPAAEIRMHLRMHFRSSRAEEASMPTGSKAEA